MFERDEYMEMVEDQLIPLDDKPVALPSILVRWYVAYCLLTWTFCGLVGVALWRLFQ